MRCSEIRCFRRLGFVCLLLSLGGCAPAPELTPPAGELLQPCPDTPNCVSTLASDSVHAIAPLELPGASTVGAIQRAKAAMLMEDRVILVEERPTYLRFEARSRFLRFVDDVEIAIAEGDTVLHFRSASRVGRGDVGVNRGRMERFRGRFYGTTRWQGRGPLATGELHS